MTLSLQKDTIMLLKQTTTTQNYRTIHNYDTNKTDQSNTIDKTNSTSSNKLSFEITSNSNINPIDISMEEYKKLTYNDLSTMYSKNNETLFSQAISLWNSAIVEGDTLIKEITFEMNIETFKNNPNEKSGAGSLSLFILAVQNTPFETDENGIVQLDENFRNHTFYERKEKINISYDFILESEKKYYKSLANSTEEYKSEMDKIKITDKINELKSRYEEKIKENERVLQEYLRR